VIWIVFNNGGLGLTEQAQRKHGPNPHGVHFSKVFFARLAEAFGLEGVRIDPGRNLYLILEELKNSGKSAIIDVPVVYTPQRKSYRDES
jgi:thiamine pyrophosphate-dependent acetolactate synthase large subunit-like protein